MSLPIEVSFKVQEIAKYEFSVAECLQQIAIDRVVFWSWGVKKRVNFLNKALLLKVSGKLFKGWVCVNLAGDDTYTVTLIKQAGTVISSHDGIYCDELQMFVDSLVETKY